LSSISSIEAAYIWDLVVDVSLHQEKTLPKIYHGNNIKINHGFLGMVKPSGLPCGNLITTWFYHTQKTMVEVVILPWSTMVLPYPKNHGWGGNFTMVNHSFTIPKKPWSGW